MAPPSKMTITHTICVPVLNLVSSSIRTTSTGVQITSAIVHTISVTAINPEEAGDEPLHQATAGMTSIATRSSMSRSSYSS
jgi:hypothetical protein